METREKKPFYKRWWFILFASLLVLSAIANIFESDETKEKREKERIEAEQKKEDEKKKKEEAKKKEKEEEKREMERKSNRTIVEIIEEDYDKVDTVTFDDGVLIIETNPGTVWSENSLFLSVYDLFEVMHDAFEDESVKEVQAKILTTMVDNKGNESVDSVIDYLYTRDTFDELNYEKFSDMAYGQQWRILNEADQYFIHPGIYKSLKDDYKNNLNHGMSNL